MDEIVNIDVIAELKRFEKEYFSAFSGEDNDKEFKALFAELSIDPKDPLTDAEIAAVVAPFVVMVMGLTFGIFIAEMQTLLNKTSEEEILKNIESVNPIAQVCVRDVLRHLKVTEIAPLINEMGAVITKKREELGE